jgi:hypothetical protein
VYYVKPIAGTGVKITLGASGTEETCDSPVEWEDGVEVEVSDAANCCPNLGGSLDNEGCENFDYNNVTCAPLCEIADFEGSEMFKSSSINVSGYDNILVEYKISVEGLDSFPHGPHPFSDPGENLSTPIYSYVGGNNPFHICRGSYGPTEALRYSFDYLNSGLKTSQHCADSRQIEEMLTILMTGNEVLPLLEESANYLVRLQNISKWRIVDTLPWKLLQSVEEESNGVRYIDLGMLPGIDSALNLWFRFQGNSLDDKVHIEYVKLYGVSQ